MQNHSWSGARVFTTALGVKIRRVNGRYQYNPPSLKFMCVRILDHHYPDPVTPKLYATVQGFLDQLIDKVEDHLEGLHEEGTLESLPTTKFKISQECRGSSTY